MPNNQRALDALIDTALAPSSPLADEELVLLWQHSKTNAARRAKIAERGNLPEALRQAVAADTAAAVRTAYLLRSDVSAAVMLAALEGEKRPKVLLVAASCATAPPEVYEYLARLESVMLSQALLVNEAAPTHVRRQALLHLYDRNHPTPESALAFVAHDRAGWGVYLARGDANCCTHILCSGARPIDELRPLITNLQRLRREPDANRASVLEALVEHQPLTPEMLSAVKDEAMLLNPAHIVGGEGRKIDILQTTTADIDSRSRARTSNDPVELASIFQATDDMCTQRELASNRASSPELAATAALATGDFKAPLSAHKGNEAVRCALLRVATNLWEPPAGPHRRRARHTARQREDRHERW